MAQRTVHYLLGELLWRECPMADRPRFLLGSILPDAYAEQTQRETSHFLVRVRPDRRYFDFEAFRRRFAAQMTDDLYLGYYMHLVEDAFYRRFFRETFYVSTTALSPAEVEPLHRDYMLLNAWIVGHYGLNNCVERPADFEREPIAAITDFRLEEFLAAFAADFEGRETGQTRFLTPEKLQRYLDGCLELCVRELRKVLAGGMFLHAPDLAWPN